MKFNFSVANEAVYPIQVALERICLVETEGGKRQLHKKAGRHKCFLCLTTQGAGEIIADGSRTKVTENTALVLKPETEYAHRCTEETWKYWWVEFDCPENLTGLGECTDATSIEEACLYLQKCLELSKRGLARGASSLLAVALSALSEGETATPESGNLSAQAVRYVLDYLSSVTVSGLCAHLNVSDRTLRNLFHRWFDMSPKKFILKCRMELARQLLEETSFSIGEVSHQLGFANPFHFSGSFKGYYGISPTQYRRNGAQ